MVVIGGTAVKPLVLARASGIRTLAHTARIAQGLAVTRIGQRDLAAQASRELKRAPEELRATVAELGREVGAPWGADQKEAALLAWLLLTRPRGFAAQAKRA